MLFLRALPWGHILYSLIKIYKRACYHQEGRTPRVTTRLFGTTYTQQELLMKLGCDPNSLVSGNV